VRKPHYNAVYCYFGRFTQGHDAAKERPRIHARCNALTRSEKTTWMPRRSPPRSADRDQLLAPLLRCALYAFKPVRSWSPCCCISTGYLLRDAIEIYAASQAELSTIEAGVCETQRTRFRGVARLERSLLPLRYVGCSAFKARRLTCEGCGKKP